MGKSTRILELQLTVALHSIPAANLAAACQQGQSDAAGSGSDAAPRWPSENEIGMNNTISPTETWPSNPTFLSDGVAFTKQFLNDHQMLIDRDFVTLSIMIKCTMSYVRSNAVSEALG